MFSRAAQSPCGREHRRRCSDVPAPPRQRRERSHGCRHQGKAKGSHEWEHAVVIAIYELTRSPRSIGTGEFRSNPEWERLHKRFHMALIGGCGNQIILDLCSQLYDRAIRYRALSIARAHTKRSVPQKHQELADVTLSRNPEKAVALLCAHYRRTADLLVEGTTSARSKE